MELTPPARSLTARVIGARAAETVPSWGEWSIWQWHGRADEEVHFANAKVYPLDPGADSDTVVAAIAGVIGRHDALRTVFDTVDGSLRQVVQSTGDLCVDVYESDAATARTTARAGAQRLASTAWNGRQWPIRVAVVTTDGRVAYLVLAYNRLVIDGLSMAVVREEILSSIADVDDQQPRWQLVEEIDHQRSAEGRARDEAAMDYWRTVLAAAPRSMFDHPTSPGEAERFVQVMMESPGLARSVRVLRKRWRVTNATLLVAAFAVVLRQRTGHDRVVMRMVTANRADRNRRKMVGTLTSDSLLLLDVDDADFEQITRRAARASSDAHQFGYCDPRSIRAVRDECDGSADLGVYFNDLQTGQETSGDEPVLSEQDMAELAADSTLDSVRKGPDVFGSFEVSPTRAGVRLLLMALHGRDMPLQLFGDTRYVPVEAMGELLCGMERLLVAAAVGAVAAGDLGPVTGVTPVRRDPSWVRLGEDWSQTAASASA